jgi:lipooligosaccharide transport system permease protein
VQFTVESYRVTPISVSEIVIAKIFTGFTHGLIKGLVVGLVIFAITPFRFPLEHLLQYLLFLVPGSAFFSCAGVISGTVMDKPETIGKVEAVLVMPLIFMSGLFFPLSSYPPSVISWVRALPTTALFEGARRALIAGEMMPLAALQVSLSALLTFVAAVYIFRYKMSE